MKELKGVEGHYDSISETYSEQYKAGKLYDTSASYPANFFRLQLLLNSFANTGAKRVIEVGVGEGTPLTTLGKAGIEVWGFDIAAGMVAKSKERVKDIGQSEDQIFLADIQDPTSYVHCLKDGPFDALVAMGVMPHVKNDAFVLGNMGAMLKPGGKVFVEFRNKIFSLFTFNRNTYDFILDDLLAGVSPEITDPLRVELEKRCRMDMPPRREKTEKGGPGYDTVLSRFHNPFEVLPLMERCGYGDAKLLWYHYHPTLPFLQEQNPALFRSEAINLEHESSGWKGYFLCSAFVVEATKL